MTKNQYNGGGGFFSIVHGMQQIHHWHIHLRRKNKNQIQKKNFFLFFLEAFKKKPGILPQLSPPVSVHHLSHLICKLQNLSKEPRSFSQYSSFCKER
uniref:Uncharacterized protein n=1 Tax=Arundo donax TaxID=35708 RepID=A0A0A9HGB6_ARUDO